MLTCGKASMRNISKKIYHNIYVLETSMCLVIGDYILEKIRELFVSLKYKITIYKAKDLVA